MELSSSNMAGHLALTLHETFILNAFMYFDFSASIYQHQNDISDWDTGFLEQIVMAEVQGDLVPMKTGSRLQNPFLLSEYICCQVGRA